MPVHAWSHLCFIQATKSQPKPFTESGCLSTLSVSAQPCYSSASQVHEPGLCLNDGCTSAGELRPSLDYEVRQCRSRSLEQKDGVEPLMTTLVHFVAISLLVPGLGWLVEAHVSVLSFLWDPECIKVSLGHKPKQRKGCAAAVQGCLWRARGTARICTTTAPSVNTATTTTACTGMKARKLHSFGLLWSRNGESQLNFFSIFKQLNALLPPHFLVWSW